MEINYHQQVVEKMLEKYLFKFDCRDCTNQHDITNELVTFLRARTRHGDNPPKITVLGPPGSGRTTQSEKIAKRFGLVVLCPEKLVEEEIKKNPGLRLPIRIL
jgi:Holliday junction resolvasome RuvABC ATP-dependent DNA helicase subunit